MSYIYRIESVFVPASSGITASNSPGLILERRIVTAFGSSEKHDGLVIQVLTEEKNGTTPPSDVSAGTL